MCCQHYLRDLKKYFISQGLVPARVECWRGEEPMPQPFQPGGRAVRAPQLKVLETKKGGAEELSAETMRQRKVERESAVNVMSAPT